MKKPCSRTSDLSIHPTPFNHREFAVSSADLSWSTRPCALAIDGQIRTKTPVDCGTKRIPGVQNPLK